MKQRPQRGHCRRGLTVAALLAVLGPATDGQASYAVYVGRNLTADGSVLIGGTGEEVSSHWLEIVPHHSHPEGATVRVGVTDEANIPGELIEIPQVDETFRYLTMNYTNYLGFPPPLTNGGLNERGVAIRDVWSTSRQELIEMTPTPQQGVNYSDLARLMLERASTAREAVELLGRLIEEHGYATYGGNSHLIADANEGWVVLELAGGQGLWAAERLGPDEIRVSYPGYIGEVPEDFLEREEFMGSENLISFAVEQGWWDPEGDEPFSVYEVYSQRGREMREPGVKYVGQRTLEDDLMELAPNITPADVMAWVRDWRIADDEAGYGQVAHLRGDRVRPDLRRLWVAPTGSITAPFVPYWIGVERVPTEFRQHRYLTRESDATFLHPDFAAQEASEFAGRVFKRLMYLVCEHPNRFWTEVTEALIAFEARTIEELPAVEATAEALFAAGEADRAREYLTLYSNSKAREALELGRGLLAGVEARTRALYGIREPEGDEINAEGGADRHTVNCRDTLTGPLRPLDLPAGMTASAYITTEPHHDTTEHARAVERRADPAGDETTEAEDDEEEAERAAPATVEDGVGWKWPLALIVVALIGIGIGWGWRGRAADS